jgi:hypothetical protein
MFDMNHFCTYLDCVSLGQKRDENKVLTFRLRIKMKDMWLGVRKISAHILTERQHTFIWQKDHVLLKQLTFGGGIKFAHSETTSRGCRLVPVSFIDAIMR